MRRYFEDPDTTVESIRDEVREKLRWLEAETSRKFGAGPRPLLVSVRSGAALSMPGMLDTVLDLGIDDAVESALAELHSPEFAGDTRQRFRHMYRRIVLGNEDGAVPDDPFAQLGGAIGAVFSSWNSPRAIAYRKHHGLSEVGGTAVVVQAMVFGNMGLKSGTGVLFSRNPMTGANEPFGEWLAGGQGEDVVSGTFRRGAGVRATRRAAGDLRRVDDCGHHPRANRQRCPGHRIHRGARQAVAAADPGGQAVGAGCGAVSPGAARRRPDR